MGFVLNGRPGHKPHGGVRTYYDGVAAHLDAELVDPPATCASGWPGHAWEQVLLPRRAEGRPLLSTANFGPIRYADQVVVIHDAAVFDIPHTFAKGYARQARMVAQRLARSGAVIATVSEFSRSRLAEVLQVNPADIVMAPGGVRDLGDTLPDRTPEPSFVCVAGDGGERKNVATVLAAFDKLLRHLPEATLTLVTAGGRHASPSAARPSGTPGVSPVHDITDRELDRVLGTSWANVFIPSYEGFGLPAIEAQAMGTPSVLSKIEPLQELASSHDLVIDLRSDVAGIAEAMASLAASPLSHDERATTAAAARSTWRWERTADALRGALETIASR